MCLISYKTQEEYCIDHSIQSISAIREKVVLEAEHALHSRNSSWQGLSPNINSKHSRVCVKCYKQIYGELQ